MIFGLFYLHYSVDSVTNRMYIKTMNNTNTTQTGRDEMKKVVSVKVKELKKRNGDVKGYQYTAVFTDHSELVIRKCSTRLHDYAFVVDEPQHFESYKCNRGFLKGKDVESLFVIHKKHLDGVKGYEYSSEPKTANPEDSRNWCFGVRHDSSWGPHYSIKEFKLSI